MGLEQFADLLLKGDSAGVKGLCEQSLTEGKSADEVLNQGLLTGMEHVGKLFKAGELYLPEVMLAARAMKAGVEILEPLLGEGDATARETVILGTVKGDLHDIGKNIVGIMLRGAGYKVVDLGIDVPDQKFVDTVKEIKPLALGLSALLTTTMLGMKDVIEALKTGGVRDEVRVLIGGAPVTADFASEIGADGFSENAYEAVEILKSGG